MENTQKTHTQQDKGSGKGLRGKQDSPAEQKHSVLDLSTWREELERSLETVEGAVTSVSQFVQKKPWIAFGVAFGIGIVGSAILAKKRAH